MNKKNKKTTIHIPPQCIWNRRNYAPGVTGSILKQQ